MLCEKVTELNYVTAVTLDGKPLIEPLHEEHIILGRCYAVEDDYLYWIEYPDPRLEATSNLTMVSVSARKNRWRGTDLCGSRRFCRAENINFGEYILQNCDFHQGNIIWLRWRWCNKRITGALVST